MYHPVYVGSGEDEEVVQCCVVVNWLLVIMFTNVIHRVGSV